jgi:ABC-type antimicrobial peptide transport system permease subunit
MVLRQGVGLTAWGVVAGLVAALPLTRVLRSLLFGTAPTDPLTFAAVAIVVGAAALLACYIPALRATRVDPAIALHAE